MERKLYVEIDGQEVETANAATKTSACLQIASGNLYYENADGMLPEAKDAKPYLVLHSEKVEALRSIVEEAAGMPILVAYNFRHELEVLRAAFKEARVLDKNPKTIREWNAGKIPMLLAHPASCGHGLSLQDGGNILVFYSTNWNLEEHDQMVERIGPTRQAQSGHPRSVFVYTIVAKDTLDEAVLERIATKRNVMDILLEKKNGG